MLLVLAIIVVIVAIAVPAIQGTISSQSLVKAGDRVRTAMGQARVQAIRSGDVHAVFFARGGSEFQVAPFNNAGQLQSNRNNQQLPFASDYSDTQLPRGIRFAAGELAVNSRDSEARAEAGGSNGLESILFYPDGTSQNARLVLQNEVGSLVAVELRGLTGVAKSFRIESNGGTR
jgi:Tfp pilus assembly protein FimT